MAQIPCCYGSGVGRWLQLRFDPLAWEPPYAVGAAQEKAKRQKKERKKIYLSISKQHYHSVNHTFQDVQKSGSGIPNIFYARVYIYVYFLRKKQ